MDYDRNKLLKEFFANRDETGRFIIKSPKTGRTYFVEPVGYTRTGFGDVNPATKEVEGSYGTKYRGSIDEKDSLLTPENGFSQVYELGLGESPEGFIMDLESKLN